MLIQDGMLNFNAYMHIGINYYELLSFMVIFLYLCIASLEMFEYFINHQYHIIKHNVWICIQYPV